MMNCKKCGRETKRLLYHKEAEGWCQPCVDALSGPAQTAPAVFRDDIPGGLTVENYGPQPITFYSHGERRRYMEAHGLHEKETFCPLPGTDKDPQGIPNPAGYVDAYTLAAGAALIARNGQKDWDGQEAGVLRNLTSTTETQQEAIRVQHQSRE